MEELGRGRDMGAHIFVYNTLKLRVFTSSSFVEKFNKTFKSEKTWSGNR